MNYIHDFEFSIYPWILFIIIVSISIWYYKRLNLMSLLDKNGIPGNKPHFIFGNLLEKNTLSIVERQKQLIEKYGKIVGYYTGANPNILVADPELANRILIKDFNNFTNRSSFLDYLRPNRKVGSIARARDQRWREIRGLLSPAFSSHKLKAMTPIIEESIDTFLDKIGKKSEKREEFNIYEVYKRISIEIILKIMFGIEIDFHNNNNIELLEQSELLSSTKYNKIILLIFSCFPEFANVIHYIRAMAQHISQWFVSTPYEFIWNTFSIIIDLRKDNQDIKRVDILQSLLDSKIIDEDLSDIMIEKLKEGNYEKKLNTDQNDIKCQTIKNSIRLTEEEIKVNCIIFLGAGYDTTSSVLAYVTHMLINYPEIQEKMRKEVIELYESEGKLDYNTLTKLDYMECVINETLRLYPTSSNGSTRECSADYQYKLMTIPKGATVTMCTHILHYDPDYWPEPENFDPMRFSPERRHEIVSGSYLPFGLGPRKCIAIRSGYLIMKMIMAKILLKYRLEAGPNSEIGKLNTKFKLLSIVPKNGVFVKIVPI